MSTRNKIVALLDAREGKARDLKMLLFGMAPHCRAEPGNLRWDVWEDRSEPGRFVLDELYVDEAAVTAHRETQHFKDYFARIDDLADRLAVALSPADIAGAEGGET
jgi:quinol monooxygenase YgiN